MNTVKAGNRVSLKVGSNVWTVKGVVGSSISLDGTPGWFHQDQFKLVNTEVLEVLDFPHDLDDYNL